MLFKVLLNFENQENGRSLIRYESSTRVQYAEMAINKLNDKSLYLCCPLRDCKAKLTIPFLLPIFTEKVGETQRRKFHSSVTNEMLLVGGNRIFLLVLTDCVLKAL